MITLTMLQKVLIDLKAFCEVIKFGPGVVDSNCCYTNNTDWLSHLEFTFWCVFERVKATLRELLLQQSSFNPDLG